MHYHKNTLTGTSKDVFLIPEADLIHPQVTLGSKKIFLVLSKAISTNLHFLSETQDEDSPDSDAIFQYVFNDKIRKSSQQSTNSCEIRGECKKICTPL